MDTTRRAVEWLLVGRRRYCVDVQIDGARFGHVNVTSRDWRRLADFYREVFGMEQAGPERDISGTDLDRATGLTGAHLRGAHLRLPGGGDDGPTLEIFSYDTMAPDPGTATPHRAGWGHIAIMVPDVPVAQEAVVAGGGAILGDAVTMATKDGRRLTWGYVTDPDGNILELQTWHAG
jgi:catechol 2,3-dioxygenase-like lactoylglutathione lyase family enzyme